MYLDHLYSKNSPVQYVTYADVQCAAMECAETLFKSDAEIIKYEAQYTVFAKEADEGGFFNKVKEIASKVWEAIKKFFGYVKNFFVSLFKKIKDFFTKGAASLEKEAKAEEKAPALTSEQKTEIKEKAAELKAEVENKTQSIAPAQAAPEEKLTKTGAALKEAGSRGAMELDKDTAIECIDEVMRQCDAMENGFAKLAKLAYANAQSTDQKIVWRPQAKEALVAFLNKKKTEEARQRSASHIAENLDIISNNAAPVRESVKRYQKIHAECNEINKRFEDAIKKVEESIKKCEGYMAKAKPGSIVYNQMSAAAKDFNALLNEIKDQATNFNKTEVRAISYVKRMGEICAKIRRHEESHSKEFDKAKKKYGDL